MFVLLLLQPTSVCVVPVFIVIWFSNSAIVCRTTRTPIIPIEWYIGSPIHLLLVVVHSPWRLNCDLVTQIQYCGNQSGVLGFQVLYFLLVLDNGTRVLGDLLPAFQLRIVLAQSLQLIG